MPPTRPGQTDAVIGTLAASFLEIVRVPFQHSELIWGIVPLYFSWAVAELTAAKATYNTAVQTGFALLWAGSHWLWKSFPNAPRSNAPWIPQGLVSLSGWVTVIVVVLGALALVSGLRRRYPPGMRFLGHTRFAGYFMIALFPIQAGELSWTWVRVSAITFFAVPIWILLHLLLKPLLRR